MDISITPSACRVRSICSSRVWPRVEVASCRTSSSSVSSSTVFTPTATSAKNGSANTCGLSLEIARTTAPTCWVASARAVAFGTYPRSETARCTASRFALLTCGALLITRDAADRDTPARSATSSSVTCRFSVTGHPSAIVEWIEIKASGPDSTVHDAADELPSEQNEDEQQRNGRDQCPREHQRVVGVVLRGELAERELDGRVVRLHHRQRPQE